MNIEQHLLRHDESCSRRHAQVTEPIHTELAQMRAASSDLADKVDDVRANHLPHIEQQLKIVTTKLNVVIGVGAALLLAVAQVILQRWV